MQNVPTIDVGIMNAQQVNFSFNGKYKLKQNNKIYEAQQSVVSKNGHLCISGQEITAQELYFTPVDFNLSSFELQDVTIGVNFHWEQKETQKFRGALKLIIENGKVTPINVLPIEDYLVSVISSEMSANSSLELLKAHAIISRSWLIAQIEKQDKLTDTPESYASTFATKDEYIKWYDREDHINFHVCADDHCQRYQGITRSHNPNVAKAVKETAGIILSYNGTVCDARFSKCCGGIAELFENCWEPQNHPYLTAVWDKAAKVSEEKPDLTQEEQAIAWISETPDAFCNTNDENILKQVLNDYDWSAKDFFRWTVSYTQYELSALIHRQSGHDFGTIIDLIPVERGTSGRLIKLKIIGTKKTLTIGKELEIRRCLSESHLYSSAFFIEKQNLSNGIPSKFILHGAGWGHGVGLCQIGAAVMGHKGYKYNEILQHYFKGATLEKRY